MRTTLRFFVTVTVAVLLSCGAVTLAVTIEFSPDPVMSESQGYPPLAPVAADMSAMVNGRPLDLGQIQLRVQQADPEVPFETVLSEQTAVGIPWELILPEVTYWPAEQIDLFFPVRVTDFGDADAEILDRRLSFNDDLLRLDFDVRIDGVGTETLYLVWE